MPNFPQICLENVTSISVTIAEGLKLYDKFNRTDVCKLEVTTHGPSLNVEVLLCTRL